MKEGLKKNLLIYVLSALLLIASAVLIWLLLTRPIKTRKTALENYEEEISQHLNGGDVDVEATLSDLENYIEEKKEDVNEANVAKKILAEFYTEKKEYEKAIALLADEPGKDLNNTNKVTTLSRLAELYALTGDEEKEREVIEKILDLPDDFELEYENILLIKEISKKRLDVLNGEDDEK